MDLIISQCESIDPARSESTTGRHLRVVPEPAVTDGEADVPAAASDDSTTTGRGFASVTYLPSFVPTEEDHDGDDDLEACVAAVLPVPTL
jgi:hypothetical protein